MFMSTLTPGGFSAHMRATVDTLSTRVAVNPPCSAPPRLRWDSSNVSSHVHLPWDAATTSTWGYIGAELRTYEQKQSCGQPAKEPSSSLCQRSVRQSRTLRSVVHYEEPRWQPCRRRTRHPEYDRGRRCTWGSRVRGRGRGAHWNA